MKKKVYSIAMTNYKFSGHETFQCRHFWLKKGYDFLSNDYTFKSNESVVELGVGKNMVASIGHWMKVFGLTEVSEDSLKVTQRADVIFGVEGYDPYLEDRGTLFLLHHYLLTNSEFTLIYNLAFGEFRRSRIDLEFTAKQLFEFVWRRLKKEGLDQRHSENSLKNDVKVFLRMYHASSRRGAKSLEDDYSSLLIDLNLISPVPSLFIEGDQVYKLEYNEKEELDELIFMYAIIDLFEGQDSISVDDIQKSISDNFLCNREGTDVKLNKLQERNLLVYKVDAGRKEVQFKKKLKKEDILKKYYGTV